jgi:hypothetical protein
MKKIKESWKKKVILEKKRKKIKKGESWEKWQNAKKQNALWITVVIHQTKFSILKKSTNIILKIKK